MAGRHASPAGRRIIAPGGHLLTANPGNQESLRAVDIEPTA